MFNFSFSSDFNSKDLIERFIESLHQDEKIILQTSGSTGKPKLLTQTVDILKISARKTNLFFHFNESTKALLCMNPETIAGKMMIVRALVGNYSLKIVQPSTRPLAFLEEKIDFIALVPLQLRETLLHDSQKLKQVKTILIGGGPIPADLVNLLRKNEITVYHSFGMTETVSHIALRKVGLETEDVFQALSGVHFKTMDSQLIIYSADLAISELMTNDIVKLISPTSFEWLGRKDFVINSGGFKLHPETLEEKWTKILSIPFFVWKETDEKWGEKMVLFLEGTKCPKLLKNSLLDYFKPHEIPKNYYLVKKFVYTQSGKLDRLKTASQPYKICREETF